MSLSDLQLRAIVSEAAQRWSYLAKSSEAIERLRRLESSDEALMAWRRIANSKIRPGITDATFHEVCSWISRETAVSTLTERDLRTQREIRQAGTRAAELAEELLSILENNAALDFSGMDLLPRQYIAAHTRLARGIVFCSKKGCGERYFPESVERELDEYQEREYPESRELTTAAAIHALDRAELYTLDGLKMRLQGLASRARQAAENRPIVPRPNHESAPEHAYAVSLCHMFKGYFNSPCHDIAAGLTSAVFERVIDEENVKKWWKRDASD